MTILNDSVTPRFCVAEIKVTYQEDRSIKRERVTSSRDAFYMFRQHWTDQINRLEEFYILCLNRANEVVGIYLVSTGGTAATYVDAKVIFQVALGCHSSSIILAHNHPSGNMSPSAQDKELTKKFREIGRLLDCVVLDHLILGPDQDRYFSFADEGI
ncbi:MULTISPECIES: JAB domain-containing protein [Spirosoma]|uniref:DNA repair protein n=1 Tax=Spirosoma sordidisoli TaxID=2502893 RepID=A0A4V1RWC7_9BACT|nr:MULTISPECIES: JAB domain-containing protein [Spirosoma]RYC69808.1 DNA repair protein [Spirosoma sordidisoli]